MKRNILMALALMTAGSLIAADAKDEVMAAAKKVEAAANYSWTSTSTNANANAGGGGGGGGNRRGGGGRGGAGAISGMMEKGGFTVVTFGSGDNAMKGVVKGEKGAIETQDGWQSIAEMTADNGGGGGGNRGMFAARRLQNLKGPAADAEAMLEKVKSLTKAEDAYTGELTEEGAKSLMMFGGRGGNNGPEISGAKATVKFWVKGGMLTGYETHVTGSMSFNGNDVQRDTTTKVEIKDVGTTKVEVPEDAKKKI